MAKIQANVEPPEPILRMIARCQQCPLPFSLRPMEDAGMVLDQIFGMGDPLVRHDGTSDHVLALSAVPYRYLPWSA